ncbi:nucleotidyl transferase AbiEii/AbiGii toxin family protein [Rhodoflexus caldus]|uniref:nucleotidyl transferase AbiEii/AbiGii toxin family protein n=1 Tax=Rhodoflexus caldus TaxID=2891236 RepID=UPI00202A5E7A|nr:nucleotidyl transferase AbiEii/AbiGii toxin family protein [Rhodoflexus caldus]
MLHYATIRPETLGLLKAIMEIPELSDFYLAGGTALALQEGHRMSYDLDFFGNCPFTADEIIDLLSPIISVQILQQSKNILILDAQGIKVDFVNYRYSLITAPLLTDNIRLLAKPDIGAMKLAAIAGRGRKRDFTDIFFLLRTYSLDELITFYNQKYPDGSEMMVARSLSYFDDADTDEDLILLQQVTWEAVKQEILSQVKKRYR